MVDYSGLREPIAPGAACGVDLREDESGVTVYRAIRDARSDARAQDRTAESFTNEEGATDGLPQPSPRWRDVHDLALDALSTRTKDIELFAWLMEAAIRTHGLAALAEIADAFRQVVNAQFANLHSIDDETPADRVVPLAGLNGSGSDGTLTRPLRLASLLPNQPFGRYSLWDFDEARRSGDGTAMAAFTEAVGVAPASEFAAMQDAAGVLLDRFAGLDTFLTERIGGDAPSFSRLRDLLDDMVRVYGELGAHASRPAAPPPPNAPEGAEAPAAPANGAAPRGAVADREDAFARLLEVAAFFRRTEPHSTIPMALETMVRRGRMDFLGLLVELVPDENQRRDVLTRAGIDPPRNQ